MNYFLLVPMCRQEHVAHLDGTSKTCLAPSIDECLTAPTCFKDDNCVAIDFAGGTNKG